MSDNSVLASEQLALDLHRVYGEMRLMRVLQAIGVRWDRRYQQWVAQSGQWQDPTMMRRSDWEVTLMARIKLALMLTASDSAANARARNLARRAAQRTRRLRSSCS
ncbi:hypothetical protein AB6D11_18760 [Vibrio splendidus]